MRIVAQRGKEPIFLVVVKENVKNENDVDKRAIGVVADASGDDIVVHMPMQVTSIVARGYWNEVEQLDSMLNSSVLGAVEESLTEEGLERASTP